MPKMRLMSDDEFSRDWLDTWHQVLGRKELRMFFALGEPFDKPDWVQTALPCEITTKKVDLHAHRPQDYPDKIKIGLDVEPLLDVLQERGTTEIIASCRSGNPEWDAQDAERGFLIHAAVEPTVEGLAALKTTQFLSYRSLCFSKEADWGLVGTQENCSILAAEPAFMERFFHFAGGEDAVRLRFYWYDDCYDWGMDAQSDADIIEMLYGLAGWPVPEYTHWVHGPYDEYQRDVGIKRPAWAYEMRND